MKLHFGLSFYGFLLAITSQLVSLHAAELRLDSLTGAGELTVTGAFTNGVCLVERKDELSGSWKPEKNFYTTSATAHASLSLTGSQGFYRVSALDINGRYDGFTHLTRAYGMLSTSAGAGGLQDFNNWKPEYEGG